VRREVRMLSIEKKKRENKESLQQLAQYFGQELLEKGYTKGDLVTAATIIIDQAIKSNPALNDDSTNPNHNLQIL
jgi:hypothetical protein